jgi:hypothetical protein
MTIPETDKEKTSSGIRAKTIKAVNVVVGAKIQGGDAAVAESLIRLAKELARGGIDADAIEAHTIVAGLHYISDPKNSSPDELCKEVALFRKNVETAVQAGEIRDKSDAEDLKKALVEAEKELAEPKPRGNMIVRRLKTAADILNQTAETAQAAGKLQDQIIKLAPTAAVLCSIASALFT